MRTPLSMAGGGYTLPGLNEYKITVKKFRIKGDPLPPMAWSEYWDDSDERKHDYHLGAVVEGIKPIYMEAPRPTGFELGVPPSYSDWEYQIIWNDDPEYIPAP